MRLGTLILSRRESKILREHGVVFHYPEKDKPNYYEIKLRDFKPEKGDK